MELFSFRSMPIVIWFFCVSTSFHIITAWIHVITRKDFSAASVGIHYLRILVSISKVLALKRIEKNMLFFSQSYFYISSLSNLL